MTLALLLTALQGVWADPTAQAVWVESTKTLHFIYQQIVVDQGGDFNGQIATSVWSGDAVTATGTNSPGWRNVDIMNSVTKVKFDNSFAAVKPSSFFDWFWGFSKVTEFEGLQYLNTSEATTMDGMFYGCSSLKSIDISTFDMSKVTDVSRMFWGCRKLKTIKCDKTWNYAADKSVDLFWACNDLKGAKEYSNSTVSDYDATMANPVTGYFTMTDGTTMSGEGTEASPIQLSKTKDWEVVGNYVAAGKSGSGMYFQMTDNFVVKTMIGTNYVGQAFSGTFDGNNKLLYVNIERSGEDISFTAPFCSIDGATIKGVTVAGTVKGGSYSAGLVGYVAGGTSTITDCYVMTEVTTTGINAGGVVGHGGNNPQLTVSGCVFAGKMESNTSGGNAGAIIGYCNGHDNITVKDCFEICKDNTYTNFTNKAFGYSHTDAFGGTRCYSFNGLAGATQVYEIDGAEGLVTLTPTIEGADHPTTLTFYGTSENAGGFKLKQVDEISTNKVNDEVIGAVVSDYDDEFYAAAGDVVQFTSPVNVTSEDVTIENNQFPMPAKKVTLSTGKVAYAVWCSDNTTLYFTLSSTAITEGGTYDSQTVTNVWSGDDVLNVGWGTPKWIRATDVVGNVTKVVFDASFANVRPTSLYKWFCDMHKLDDITGLTYLNTSEVTNMNSTFAECWHIKTLDHFDVSKVTNTSAMFFSCADLKTIYCSKSWSIPTAEKMFSNCFDIVGAVEYDSNKAGSEMANPTTGYFTKPDTKAYAIWCEDNRTLYFATSETPLSQGGKYIYNNEEHTITYLWNGDDVIKTGSVHPQWLNDGLLLGPQHVVFDASFASIKPTSLFEWFKNFANLEDITGLEYLKTNEATTTARMFANCIKLTILDLRSFNMSKVTDTQEMFYDCLALTTILCNDTWTATSSSQMFYMCSNLVGAVSYDESKINVTMANPYSGYFTGDHPYELASTEDWNRLAAYVKADNNCSGKTFMMTADFEAGEMIGTSEHPFCGVFDGQSHILTVKYGSESESFNEDYCAPFRYTDNDAKVKNLILAGDIYTSKQYAAGVIAHAYDNATLDNVLCTVNIHSTVSGEGKHGGLVARVDGDNSSMGTTIMGCSFQGSLLGSSTTTVGGFVGYKETSSYVTIFNSFFAPKEITVLATASYTFCGGSGDNGSIYVLTIGEACYYTTALGTTQGKKALKITDESESIYFLGTYSMYNTSQIITFTKDDSHKGYAMQAFVVDEIDDGDLEGEPLYFSAAGTVFFGSTSNDLAVKDADGTAVTLYNGGNHNYYFTMPAKDVTITGGGTVAYAIWCEGNKTLYFDYSEEKKSMGGTYQGQTITALWTGNDVLNTGWNTPAWNSLASGATTVVFTEDFKNAKPTSMNRWFWNFKQLATITGLDNLNTEDVTVMNSTFYNCWSLESIDVNSFDVSKVTNASAMFCNCSKLVTIYCDKTWNIATADNMFDGDGQLKSHNLNYDPQKKGGYMATPNNGYFTRTDLEIELASDADNRDNVTKYADIKVAKVTLTGRTFFHDEGWNTLCLPFNLESFTDTPLAGATVKELDINGTYGEDNRKTSFDAETGTLYLYFQTAESIEANKPYLVKWTDGANVTDPVFNNVTIVSGGASSVPSYDNSVLFVGTNNKQDFAKEDKSILFLGSGNMLYWPLAGASIGAQRAYFQVEATAGVRSFVLNFGDNEDAGQTTGIKELDNWTISPFDNSSDNGQIVNGQIVQWYTLDGRKLDSKPTKSGVYVKDGKKMVVK